MYSWVCLYSCKYGVLTALCRFVIILNTNVCRFWVCVFLGIFFMSCDVFGMGLEIGWADFVVGFMLYIWGVLALHGGSVIM